MVRFNDNAAIITIVLVAG